MKTVNSIPFIAIAMLLMVNIGCTPDCDTCRVVPGGGREHNTAPISNAGDDQYVFSPADFCTLNGVAQDLENNIKKISWSKITGPSSFLIEHPDSLSTKVSNLQIGVYEFELTVTDSMGLYGKDIIKVTVSQMSFGGGGSGSTTPPKANAGPDKLVYYPSNFTNLYGGMSTWGNIIQTIAWSKVSGPSSFLIETPNSLGTRVSNLQTGVYQFELRVQDNAGLTDRDTCTVIVDQISDNPDVIVFQNQIWGNQGVFTTLMWGSSIIIPNIYQYLPPGNVFRVLIKKDNSNNWEELFDDPNQNYNFYLFDGNLYIYSNIDEIDTPDIKLVY